VTCLNGSLARQECGVDAGERTDGEARKRRIRPLDGVVEGADGRRSAAVGLVRALVTGMGRE
jgi:hypothetical protein